jgi:NitT/TauT family transport system ATP-binding protein
MAPRPGRVVAEITIDAPYPRNEEFRTSRLCNDYCREVSARLMAAMTGISGESTST